MIEITLTQGFKAKIDDEDFELVSAYKWSAHYHSYWEAVAHVGGNKYIKMHRLIMNAPDGLDVDHVNGDTLNNQKKNLRLATRSQNNANSPIRGHPRGMKGTTRRGKKWVAQISIDNKNKYLGIFSSREEAAKAYDTAAKEIFGEFAYLNFPDD